MCKLGWGNLSKSKMQVEKEAVVWWFAALRQ
jgi:hypothetical protein